MKVSELLEAGKARIATPDRIIRDPMALMEDAYGHRAGMIVGKEIKEQKKHQRMIIAFRDCNRPTTRSHSCPYQSDVNEDEAFRCKCCDECKQECIDGI